MTIVGKHLSIVQDLSCQCASYMIIEMTDEQMIPFTVQCVRASAVFLAAFSSLLRKYVKDAKILRKNFVVDLLSYKDNSCLYAIPANIQQRLINITKKD
ncbi:hypothetical protein Zm00014a_010636 [Zea mays]|uniref:Uncharacterized protein n=1 Tax=Zea mays TaxID=4577 RepID=A0A3L6DVH0_MAIZE|nr:hypothetical protein Zm00014a_010636 [Zea mays]